MPSPDLALAPPPPAALPRPASARGERAPWSVAPWVAAGLTVAAACGTLLPPQLWPSSDLEGHVATVELYRTALSHGICWPYDHAAAFGTDAIPYYGWLWELLLGAVALVLGLLGVPAPAVVVTLGVTVLAVVALPLVAAWCTLQLVPPAWAVRRRTVLTHAGALAAWSFLATASGDGITGYGSGAVRMGLVEQLVGWNLVLLVLGCAARVVHRGEDRWAIDRPLAVAIALVVLVHSLSALAAALLLLALLPGAPRRLGCSGLVGLAGAGAGVAAVLACADRLTPDIPWMDTAGCDPLLALLSPLVFGSGLARWLPPAATVAGLLLVGLLLRRARRPGVLRQVAVGAGLLLAVGCLPLLHALLPGASQPYRLNALALLVALLGGGAAAPPAVAWLQRRVPRWLALLLLGSCWTGLAVPQVWTWGEDLPTVTPAAVLAELGTHLPRGSRVAWRDAVGWHRWAIDAWRLERGWESAGCIHTQILGPVVAGLAPACAILGVPACTTTPVVPLPPAEAARILQDAGITHCLRTRHLQPDPSSCLSASLTPPATWAHRRTPHLEWWTVPDPAPLLEAIRTPLVGLCVPVPHAVRGCLAEWWTRIRARHQLADRLVLLPAADPAVPLVLGPAALHPAVVVDALPALPHHTPQILRSATSGIPVSAALYAALAPVERWFAQRAAASAGPPVPPAAAAADRAAPPPALAWRSPNTCALTGLVPGQPYLLRVGWSPGMRLRGGGRCLEEANGFTVVVPTATHVDLEIRRIGPVVVGGLVVSAGALLLLGWPRRPRASGRAPPAGGDAATPP